MQHRGTLRVVNDVMTRGVSGIRCRHTAGMPVLRRSAADHLDLMRRFQAMQAHRADRRLERQGDQQDECGNAADQCHGGGLYRVIERATGDRNATRRPPDPRSARRHAASDVPSAVMLSVKPPCGT